MKRGFLERFAGYGLAIAVATGCYAQNMSQASPLARPLGPQASVSQLRAKISTGPFARLYSNTFYDVTGRIEEDGFFRESNDPLKGYDGMYPRTVGAAVSLLLTTGQPEPCERLIQCVLNAMKGAGMERIPHAFDKKREGSSSIADRYPILGRADQLDGQAHVIMAWGRLANYRGRTVFEDSTYLLIAALLNSSIRPPYCCDTTGGKIPDLMFNPVFEHSRTGRVTWRYDLLTQFFVGAALAEMIPIAERRNDPANAREWSDRLQILQLAVAKHFVVSRDGKPVFTELLLSDSNKVFEGMGWVNMAPVAAQWNPFGSEVMANTVRFMREHLSKERDGHRWLPTDSWPGGGFSAQIIGKGVGWELELASREKDWQRALEIVRLVEHLHPHSPIYMENAFLQSANGKALPVQESDTGYAFRHSPWALADPGNGEQVAWWCWAVANLRKELDLPPVPGPVTAEPRLDSTRTTAAKVFLAEEPRTSYSYTLDGSTPTEQSRQYGDGGIEIVQPMRLSVIAREGGLLSSAALSMDFLVPHNGLEYTLSSLEDGAIARSSGGVVLRKGVLRGVGVPFLPGARMPNRVECRGFFFAKKPGEYVFRLRATERAHLFVNGAEVTEADGRSASGNGRLDEGLHSFAYDVEDIREGSRIEISYSLDGGEFFPVIPEVLYQQKPPRAFVPMPEILPAHCEFEEGGPLTVRISSPANDATIFFTLGDGKGTDRLRHYSGPFTITSSTTVRAEARSAKGRRSSQAIARYVATPRRIKIAVNPAPDPRYAGNGAGTLIDGIKGTADPSDQRWLGFQGTDAEVTIDLRERKQVRQITVGCLHNPVAWVLLPKRFRLSVSDDGVAFKAAAVVDVAPPPAEKPGVRHTMLLHSPIQVRYLKIRVESPGVLPAGHSAAGRDSWIFLDEVEIQ